MKKPILISVALLLSACTVTNPPVTAPQQARAEQAAPAQWDPTAEEQQDRLDRQDREDARDAAQSRSASCPPLPILPRRATRAQQSQHLRTLVEMYANCAGSQ